MMLNLLNWNVTSLGDTNKMHNIINTIKLAKSHIFTLTETWKTPEQLTPFKLFLGPEWSITHSHYHTHQGVIIGWKDQHITCTAKTIDLDGRRCLNTFSDNTTDF